jgi:hypothetical protein
VLTEGRDKNIFRPHRRCKADRDGLLSERRRIGSESAGTLQSSAIAVFSRLGIEAPACNLLPLTSIKAVVDAA